MCTCNKNRFAKALLTLGSKELRSLHGDDQGDVETVCQYCSKKYVFSKEEIAQLAEQAEKAEKNKS